MYPNKSSREQQFYIHVQETNDTDQEKPYSQVINNNMFLNEPMLPKVRYAGTIHHWMY